MCGICGIVDWTGTPVGGAEISHMSSFLAHRGPDGAGQYLEQGNEGGASVGLGHRRLAIIDLVRGDQPMFNEDGSVAVVFNGEIYNFVDLRRELAAHGHTFRTASDTEVLVHAYEEWGARLVERLDGMFAFAVWDRARQSLLLARDPAGKKPLYWTQEGSRLLFASEIGAVRAAMRTPAPPDLPALPQYLVLGYLPGATTAYVGIRQLLPGHVATAGGRGGVHARRYWDLPYASPREPPGRVEAARLGALVRRAVEKRLVADVPIGALLSGGIDSTAVVATMRELRDEVHTFTVGMADQDGYDESASAREVARHLGTRHHEIRVQPNVLGLVDAVLDHHQEPFADASAVPTYLIAKFAREHVTVVLTGDGGDEVFAGYVRLPAAAWTEHVPAPARALLGLVGRMIRPGGAHASLRSRAARMARRAGRPFGERLLGWISVFEEEAMPEVLERIAAPAYGDLAEAARIPGRQFAEVAGRVGSASHLSRALYVNFHTYLPDDLLRKVDRATMAVGLEARCPLLDRALMEYVASLDDRAKVQGWTLKSSLRDLLRGRVPDDVLTRPKQGFGLPLGRWLREDLREMVSDTLLAKDSWLLGLVRRPAVERLVADNLARRRDAGLQLWALLVLERWLRRFGARPEAPQSSAPAPPARAAR